MTNKNILTILIVFQLISCETPQSEKGVFDIVLNPINENEYPEFLNDSTITIPINFNSDRIKSSDLFKHNIKYLPLETTDESLFGEISQLVITANSFIVLDKKTKSILTFDHNGKFKSKIKRIGGGPQEYKIPKNIAFNSFTNSIEILDNTRGIIQRYDAETGTYQSTLKAGFTLNSFYPIEKDKYLFHIDSYLFNDQRYGQISGLQKQLLIGKETKEGKVHIISQHIDYIENSGLLNYGAQNYIKPGIDDDILISTTFNDTIFSFSDKGLKSKYALNFGQDAIPKDFFPNSDFKTIQEFYREDKLPTPEAFWETKDFTYTWGSHDNRIAHSFYSKKKNKDITVYNSDFMQAATAVGNFPIAANDTALVYRVEPQEIYDLNDQIITALERALEKEGNGGNTARRDSLMQNFINENGYHFLKLTNKVSQEDNQILAFIQPNFSSLDEKK